MDLIYSAIKNLCNYAIANDLIAEEDRVYCVNQLLNLLKLDAYEDAVAEYDGDLESILKTLLDYAVSVGIIEDTIASRDLFDAKLMNVFMPHPSAVRRTFLEKYEKNPIEATDYYYHLAKASDYIRTYRVAKDVKWQSPSKYGDLDITINLSKPEKDPKDIAAAKLKPQSGYPKCLLCKENEGYAGNINHPSRDNHRIIPVKINDKDWFFQYSPYVYYNEHCIVFNAKHTPMKIERDTFAKLLSFVKQFPHYFVGSNADLPIVGGSILAHDHFQGGHFEFAMAKAPVEKEICFKGYEDIKAGIVKWPMSVIRLSSADTDRLIDLADKILLSWREYSDPDAFILAYTYDTPHNTITPIARFRDGKYELDLVLRNNITTDEHPLGLYHPHEELHHIKKENIGLIEVMGLAVLPARLKDEMASLSDEILKASDKDALIKTLRESETLSKHADWVMEILDDKNLELITGEATDNSNGKDNIDRLLKAEIGKVFEQVLECAGVYKRDVAGQTAFMRFVEQV